MTILEIMFCVVSYNMRTGRNCEPTEENFYSKQFVTYFNYLEKVNILIMPAK